MILDRISGSPDIYHEPYSEATSKQDGRFTELRKVGEGAFGEVRRKMESWR